MAKHTIKNMTDGPKVLNAVPVIVLQAGETAEVEIVDAEFDAAILSEWFEEAKPAKAKPTE